MVSLREDLSHENPPPAGSGIERTGMLDAFAHDTREDILVLAMFETRTWEYGEKQLYQLQEKLNAYVSFILDGEMKETFPQLVEKPVRIELRTAYEPPRRAMEFLGRARDQLALQEIGLEVVLIGEQQACCGGEQPEGGGCCGGGGCGGAGQGHAHEHHGEGHHHDHPHSEGGCGCHH
jgi:hypothetical protein